MPATDPRIEKLRKTRKDYQEEVAWHRFLLDAVCSTGGFKGRVGPTAVSFLGWAAEAYARSTVTATLGAQVDSRLTYLDQFPREDARRFSNRIDVSHYINYTGPILETLLAYISKEEMNRDKIEAIREWMDGDVDGKGSTWERLMREQVRPRTAALGWCPMLIDLPRTSGAEMTVAQVREQRIEPRVIPLYPLNVLDFATNAVGKVTAVKLRIDVQVRGDLLEDARNEEHYELWYADRVQRAVVVTDAEGNERIEREETVSHSLGRVPVVFFRASKVADDAVRGPSIIGDLATVNRRIFNLDSELDDFLRNACFALLGVPVSDMKVDVGDVVAGNGTAIKIPKDSNRGLEYTAPPASVPEAQEKRREVLVREVYRCARVEHAKPSGVTTSGIARAYEFEATNRRLADVATGFAQAEQESLRIVAAAKGDTSESTTVTAPADFSVEDLTADLANVISAQTIKLGPTAETEIRRRVARRMLPNLPTDTMAAIDDELEQLRDQQEQDDAMAREVAAAGRNQAGGQDGDPEPSQSPQGGQNGGPV